MNSLSFRDMEQLSAYLDGQLSHSQRARLEIRVRSDPAIAAAMEELRQTRALLRRLPQYRAPRNFTLTIKMAGIRPPAPRLVPVLSWGSAIAMLLFIFTLGTNLVGQLHFGAPAPMLAAAPSGLGGGPPAAPATMAPALKSATDQTAEATPTEETSIMSVPEATLPDTNRVSQPPITTKAQPRPFNPWLFIWPGLGVLMGILALFIRWLNIRAFQRKKRDG